MELKIIILLIDYSINRRKKGDQYVKEIFEQITSPLPYYFDQDETVLQLPQGNGYWLERFFNRALMVASDPEYKRQDEYEESESWKHDVSEKNKYPKGTYSIFLQFVSSKNLFKEMISQAEYFLTENNLDISIKEMKISQYEYADLKKKLHTAFDARVALKKELFNTGVTLVPKKIKK